MKPRFITKEPARDRPAGPAAVLADRNGRILAWSDLAAELFGTPAEKAVGTDLAALLLHPADGRRLEDALQRGGRWIGVLPVRGAGRISDIRWCLDPMAGQAGPVFAVTAQPADTETVKDDQDRMALLNEASTRIGSRLDIAQTAAELMDLAVPRFADAAGILVHERLVSDFEFPDRATDGSALVRRLAVGVAAEDPVDWERAFPVDEVTVYPAWTPFAQCMEQGRPVLVTRMDTMAAKDIGLRVWQREPAYRVLNHMSFLVVPLTARGRVLGFVVFTRRPDIPPFDAADAALAEELATRTAICIDNARLYERERRTALTLQASLLPANLRDPLGLNIAHRYLPAGDLTGVGGDWFDVIPLPGARCGLVVGDVMGHGTSAAAAMGQLRTAVRTLAGMDLTPSDLLTRLDLMAQDMDNTPFATCVYATYDPVTCRCAIARAGHVPPIIMHGDGGSEVLDLPPGLPLGVGGATYDAREYDLAEADTLILCTDGLVESHDRDIEAGIDALRAGLADAGVAAPAAAGPDLHLEELCDAAVATVPQPDRDDIALLVARTRSLTDEDVVTGTFTSELSAPADARRLIRAALDRWDLSVHTDAAALLVSELVTNAVQHGEPPIVVRALRSAGLVVEVADSSPAGPTVRPGDPLGDNGRGMHLVKALAWRWGVRIVDEGKVVWCELAR